VKPVGVQVRRTDGTVLNAELVHEGVDDDSGLDTWLIANIDYRPGDTVLIAELPPCTAIGFRAVLRPGFRGKRC
jgi:hypothetical protein